MGQRHDGWLGWASDATDGEKGRLRPGLDLLLELITSDLEDAAAGARHLKQSLSMSAAGLMDSDPGRWRTVADAEQAQQGWRRDGCAVLRGYLRDTLVAAGSIGIPISDLPALLDQVLSDAGPDADGQPADVVRLSARRRRPTIRT